MKIKALTLWQPWASFMALGLKKIETRSWSTKYRGPLAIHAAKRIPQYWMMDAEVWDLAREKIRDYSGWPLGKILCIVELRNVSEIERGFRPMDPIEAMLGDYTPGRFVWQTKILEIFDEPIQCNGHQGLWDWKEGEQYASQP